MNLTLADSGATEALGRALAHSFPVAVREAAGDVIAWDAGAAGMRGGDGGAARTGQVPSGAVMYLQGELGAGKTTCVRSLLRTLGVVGLVRSPTYTLVETYELAGLTCVHVDLYRLQSLSEVEELGLRDLMGSRYLLLVEWPERGGHSLPAADLDLTLTYAGDGRRASLVASPPLGSEWLNNLARDSSLTPYVSNLT
jgi:tRNA threonylcarbamoyladenosine biosynthesis protein TsaE